MLHGSSDIDSLNKRKYISSLSHLKLLDTVVDATLVLVDISPSRP